MIEIIGIDPGEKESAIVRWDGEKVLSSAIIENGILAVSLETGASWRGPLVIEWIEGYGLTVGQSIFETCRWVGVFQEAYGRDRSHLISRRKVKQHLCNNVSAKDSHVSEALKHLIGEVGTKKKPGPLYGVVSHAWAALAVAVTWWDQNMH